MPVRIRERDLVVPALRLAAQKPGGKITTSQLIEELTEEFEPDGMDAELLTGRRDTYFSQKVRNLVSHRNVETSMFSRGYAEYVDGGIKITDEGRQLLDQLPE